MPEETTRAHIEENGQSAYAVTIQVSGHTLHGDEPVSFGGGNTGPAPYDMLLAALGECTALTVRWYAKQQNWPLEKVEVDLTHHKASIEGKSGKTDVFEKRLTLHGDALTDEQRQKLHDVAAKCPVQRTLEGTPIIQTL
ncbi:MAG: OsmC family protein [Alphaproteobacteria bacterium]